MPDAGVNEGGGRTGPVPHLYVHVPFCRKHCPYCDYAVTARHRPDLEGWLAAVGSELALREAEGERPARPLETLLVGGGTPSTLGPGLMAGLRGVLGDERVEGIREWGAEANPEDVTPDLADAWRRAGLTRLNVGVQSFSGPALRWLGRLHEPSAAEASARILARSGLPTWGVDLLFGLPEEAGSDPAEDVRRAVALDVPHVSLYELVAEPETPLSSRIERGELSLPGPDARADTYLELVGVLDREGYEPYEMTSFARAGHASRHTLALWRGRPYLGLGPGAHSWVEGRRSWNLRDWRAYSTRARDAVTPRAGAERPDAEEAALERAWSRLRLREGASRAELAADPDSGTADEVRRRIDGLVEGWIRRGWARPEPGRVALTPEGWLLLDDLAPALAATRSG